MFTRRTATVIISAPEASCAWTMTAGEEYLPVPTIRRDENVLSAIVNKSTGSTLPPSLAAAAIRELRRTSSPQSAIRNFRNALAAADEVDDLDLVAFTHHGRGERVPLQHQQVVL